LNEEFVLMNRRDFSLAASAAAASALTLGTSAAQAQAAAPKEGKDYIKLAKPAPTSAGAGKVEVVEFFWYSCPHCNAFEPTFAAWKNQAPAERAIVAEYFQRCFGQELALREEPAHAC
jgi:thiol:disulfide interchange protein DsbA